MQAPNKKKTIFLSLQNMKLQYIWVYLLRLIGTSYNNSIVGIVVCVDDTDCDGRRRCQLMGEACNCAYYWEWFGDWLKLAFQFLLQVITAKVVTSAKSPGSKCFGFVVLSSAEEAQQAINSLNNTEVQGQKITVEKVNLTNCHRLFFSLLCHIAFYKLACTGNVVYFFNI